MLKVLKKKTGKKTWKFSKLKVWFKQSFNYDRANLLWYTKL